MGRSSNAHPQNFQLIDNMSKTEIIEALYRFVAQRSGIDARNYGSRESFLEDYRPILQAGKDARKLLATIKWRESITPEDLIAGCGNGRLQIHEREGNVVVQYCTGQYFAVEYRKGVCRMLATVLDAYARKGTGKSTRDVYVWARGEFGRGIANRWFN